MGSMSALWTKTSVHFINSISQELHHTKNTTRVNWRSHKIDYKNSRSVQFCTIYKLDLFWRGISHTLNTNWVEISMQHASMSTQDGIHAMVTAASRGKSCKNVSKNSVLVCCWTGHWFKILRSKGILYICRSYWEEVQNSWNGKALQIMLQSQEREFPTTRIRTVVNMFQKESCYFCNQWKTDLDLKRNEVLWLVFILSKFIRTHHVISLLSISITFDHRVYKGINVYFLHFERPPDICCFIC